MSKASSIVVCLALVVITEAVLGVAIKEDGGNRVFFSSTDPVRRILQKNSLPGRPVSDAVASMFLGGSSESTSPYCEEWDPEFGCEAQLDDNGENCPDNWQHLTDSEFCLLCDYSDHKSSGTASCASAVEAAGNAEENSEAEQAVFGCLIGPWTTSVVACVRPG